MRTYEVMFITAPNTAEDDLHKLTSQLEQVVANLGGKISKIDNLGRRKLAYPIDRFDEGMYMLLNVEGSGSEIAEIERRLRVSDLVIRHITVRTDEDIRRAEKLKAQRKAQVAARAGKSKLGTELEVDEEMEEIIEE